MLAVLRSPDAVILARLSAELAGDVPHDWAAALIDDAVHSTGLELGAAAPVVTELAELIQRVPPGTTWSGRAVVGGSARQVLAVASTEPAAAGSVLVLVGGRGNATARDLVQRLWEVAVVRLRMLMSLGALDPPLYLAAGRAAAGEHAKALTALKDAHSATLTALLGALRSRRLEDSAARQAAISLASMALTGLRARPAAGERTAAEAFAAMSAGLRSLSGYSGFDLELVPPERGDRLLAPAVAAAAGTVARGCVLTMVEHTDPRRIRVGWEVNDADLTISVRDNGNGALFPQELAEYRLRERVIALGGDFAVDAVPGWGTAVTARIPLALPPVPGPDALGVLSPRELEVLTELAAGRRNREIATRLHITEHTAKFHVASILAKLGVRSRGEAAALARDAHL
ncbi:LuxR C-terminal-related transcriptional regulator [Kribbella sp. NPDC050820]|uniref:helix-turn-helix transcriptional regulator n=1 Tax=Kribbella sp. NPDC050820 TaxID=3155408 RepID=UPI0033C6B02B